MKESSTLERQEQERELELIKKQVKNDPETYRMFEEMQEKKALSEKLLVDLRKRQRKLQEQEKQARQYRRFKTQKEELRHKLHRRNLLEKKERVEMEICEKEKVGRALETFMTKAIQEEKEKMLIQEEQKRREQSEIDSRTGRMRQSSSSDNKLQRIEKEQKRREEIQQTALEMEEDFKEQMKQAFSSSSDEVIFDDPEVYESYDAHLARLGLQILRKWNGPCPQAIQELDRLFLGDCFLFLPDKEDCWTRLFDKIMEEEPGMEVALQRERTLCSERQQHLPIRSLAQHLERVQQIKHEETPHKFCVVCQEPTANRCSRCLCTCYCSVEHQKSDWKRHKKEDCKKPQVQPFFNDLSRKRGKTKCKKFNEEKAVWQKLKDDEYSMVAFPGPKITLTVSGCDKTFKAPGGKSYFSVRDLARALSDYEVQATDGNEGAFFGGLTRVKAERGEVKYRPRYFLTFDDSVWPLTAIAPQGAKDALQKAEDGLEL